MQSPKAWMLVCRERAASLYYGTLTYDASFAPLTLLLGRSLGSKLRTSPAPRRRGKRLITMVQGILPLTGDMLASQAGGNHKDSLGQAAEDKISLRQLVTSPSNVEGILYRVP